MKHSWASWHWEFTDSQYREAPTSACLCSPPSALSPPQPCPLTWYTMPPKARPQASGQSTPGYQLDVHYPSLARLLLFSVCHVICRLIKECLILPMLLIWLNRKVCFTVELRIARRLLFLNINQKHWLCRHHSIMDKPANLCWEWKLRFECFGNVCCFDGLVCKQQSFLNDIFAFQQHILVSLNEELLKWWFWVQI